MWSAWQEAGKSRQLRRALTLEERSMLELRRDELAPMVAPFPPEETDQVSFVISDMFGSFRSMRQGEDEALAIVNRTMQQISEFPTWAIEKACKSIQTNGVWREGKLDRQWPPNDSEVAVAVREATRLYADTHRSAAELLVASVEP